MDQSELRALGEQLLAEARALRAAYPDISAMRGVTISDIGTEPFGDEGAATFWAALGHLRDEMILMRAGRSGTLAVLDDELALVDSLLPLL